MYRNNDLNKKKEMMNNYWDKVEEVETRGRQWSVTEAFPVLMRKVYLWMTMALAISGATAYAVATSPAILQAIMGNSILFWGLMIAEFGLVIWLSAGINRMSLATATLAFVAYSVLNGATLSFIFLAYTMSSIAKVFLITAGTFGATALVGYTTKKDLSGFGRFFMIAIIGLIIASVVNVFLKSTGFDLIISYVGVVLFAGLTAYDTQKIKQMCMQAPDAGEQMQKYAVLGALTLYRDFLIRHGLIARDTQFFLMYPFTDGIGMTVPLGITMLFVRRYRIMDNSLYTLVLQITLQVIPMLAKDGENMPHIIALLLLMRYLGQTDKRIADLCDITSGNLFSSVILRIQIVEFHTEYSCLQFIHPAIFSNVIKYIFLRTAIISQCPDYLCQFLVIRGHRTGITQCTQVLAWIKTVSCSIAQTTCTLRSESTTVCLCIILKE